MLTCDYGCGQPSTHTLKSGKRSCSSSVSSCPAMRKKNSLAKKGKNPWASREHPRGMAGKKGKNQHIIRREKGLPPVEVAEETRLKWSVNARGRRHSDATRQRLSEVAKARRDAGWEPVCGRAKKYTYVDRNGRTVVVDGTWELIVCRYLDHLQMTWNKNKNSFVYINPSGKESRYTPDFYVEEWKSYLEVKGYETELDRCKWRQFPHTLEVWRRAKIQEISERLESWQNG